MAGRDAVPVAAGGITLPCPNCGRPWTVDMATNTKLACPRCERESADPAPRPGDAGGSAATMGTDVAALRVACRCLYLEVPKAVGEDVQRKAEAVITHLAALEAALAWYGDPANYHHRTLSTVMAFGELLQVSAADNDGGRRARAALAGAGEGGGDA